MRLLSVPFALTRSVRAPEAGLRRDLSINRKHTSDGDSTANNYSGAVVQLPARLDGRIALERKGFLRRPEQAGAPEVQAGSEELRDRFTVRATSPETAQQVLDESVCE